MENNMGHMLKIMAAWTRFKSNHPKFPAFMKAVQKRGIKEDMIIEVIITEPDGEKIETSLKLTQSDIELMAELKKISPNS